MTKQLISTILLGTPSKFADPFELESIPLPPTVIKKEDFNNLMDIYVTKSITQLEKFLVETKRSKMKLDAIFNAAEKAGYKDIQITDKTAAAVRIPKARRIKKAEFGLTARRDSISLHGSLLVKPATIHLNLYADTDTTNEITFSGYYKPVLTIKYFKNLVVYDNYLVYLIKKDEPIRGF
jgi:hypothetical protein